MGWEVKVTLQLLYAEKLLGTHCVGFWVGPLAGLVG